ncbi:MAG: hypothetical protein ACI81L_002033 [Verrucomicrobiales bacterium]
MSVFQPRRSTAFTLAITALLSASFWPATLSAQTDGDQDVSLQSQIASSVLAQGWWDDTGSLAASEMSAVVEKWGGEFAFALTDRSFSVDEDPSQNPAALLAQSTLEQLIVEGGPRTLLLVTGDNSGGASVTIPFFNLAVALDDFDRESAAVSFGRAAERAAELGTQIPPLAQNGFLDGTRIFVLLSIVAGVLALLSLRSSRKKKSRRTHTSGARESTKLELQKMSDLILDLDPRVTIANDQELKARYVDASATYREVLEYADAATSGHAVADLRIKIAKARWKLDVVDAELDGRTPPPEPLTRDSSGSAWDSTKGTGA